MSYVVIGRDPDRPPRSPVLAIGPFETEEEAQEFADLLGRTTSGEQTVLPLRTPSRP